MRVFILQLEVSVLEFLVFNITCIYTQTQSVYMLSERSVYVRRLLL
jgi:hypothetical protein